MSESADEKTTEPRSEASVPAEQPTSPTLKPRQASTEERKRQTTSSTSVKSDDFEKVNKIHQLIQGLIANEVGDARITKLSELASKEALADLSKQVADFLKTVKTKELTEIFDAFPATQKLVTQSQKARWWSRIGAGLSGLSLIIVFLLLGRSASRTNSEGSNPDSIGREIQSLEKNLSVIRDRVNALPDQNWIRNDRTAASDQLTSEINKSQQESLMQLKEVRQKLADLSRPAEPVQAAVKTPEVKIDLSPLGKTQEAVNKLTEQVKKFEEQLKAVPVVAKQPEAPARADPAIAKLQQDVAQLLAQKPEPIDLWVVALHTAKLDQNAWMAAYRNLENARPRSTRLGVLAAQTAQLSWIKPLAEEKLNPPPAAAQGAVEEPGNFGKKLLDEYIRTRPGLPKEAEPATRVRNRVILIASTQCPPLSVDEVGWREMAEVHVCLIQHEGRGDDAKLAEGLIKWNAFALERKGSVTVIPASSRDPTKILESVLVRWTKLP